ncbi:hypothetical protein B0H67DRAFT_323240 [Lasiosphaeris hirsuta]|uniref:Uncharacterized protein n=1 Tax=Lasiosphaeris hirsuta TaxID=260670 RepID=A0AA40A221_9PEZI|nr:hypothetical protein B0H67DRAFT_323240 [Lasiosphaeris hirsuta]
MSIPLLSVSCSASHSQAGTRAVHFFSPIFGFIDNEIDYTKGFWVIGLIHVGVVLAASWIPPLPKGGRLASINNIRITKVQAEND